MIRPSVEEAVCRRVQAGKVQGSHLMAGLLSEVRVCSPGLDILMTLGADMSSRMLASSVSLINVHIGNAHVPSNLLKTQASRKSPCDAI